MKKTNTQVTAKLAQYRLVIFGLGREGLSTYTFLRKYLPQEKLILIDDRSPLDLSKEWDAAKDDSLASFTSPEEYQHQLTDRHLLFVTPGIPPKHLLLKKAAAVGAKLHSNTQLFFDCVATYNQTANTKVVTIAVTGTKGKSTTSTAIAHVLKTAGLAVQLGGNIGVPALDMPFDELQQRPQHFVLELSAHQLVNTTINPTMAVLLNITPEHLDYYPSFADYQTAKARITAYQTTSQHLFFNPEYEGISRIAKQSAAQKITFGGRTKAYPQPHAYISEKQIFNGDSSLISLDELQITGQHMVENLLPAVCIADTLGISADHIRAGLQSFKPLQHRLEIVHETIDGITFVDDSLATTPEAAIAAIKSFEDVPIILLAGGHEREQDFSELAKVIVSSTISHVLLFPATGERLADEIRTHARKQSLPKLEKVTSMENAVAQAHHYAQSNTVVLLSPAAASFGVFKDYADRSAQFIQAARTFT